MLAPKVDFDETDPPPQMAPQRDPNPEPLAWEVHEVAQPVSGVIDPSQRRLRPRSESQERREPDKRVPCPSCGRSTASSKLLQQQDTAAAAAGGVQALRSHGSAMAWQDGQDRMRRSGVRLLRRWGIRRSTILDREAVSAWRSNLARDIRRVAEEEAARADAQALRVEQSRHAVEKACRQIAASARLAQLGCLREASLTAQCIANWRCSTWCEMYATMQELEEAVSLESARRAEKEQEADDLREEVVELCARMNETEARDEDIARRVAGSKAAGQARETKVRAEAHVLRAWCRGWQRDSIREPLMRWRDNTRHEASVERSWDHLGRRRMARGLPALFLSIPVWSEALHVVGLSRYDIPLKSGRIYPRPREVIEVIRELSGCFEDLDAEVRRSTLRIMSLVNKVVPAFMEARLPRKEGKQLRDHLTPLEEACTAVWKQCELVLQCQSWAHEDVMHACEEDPPAHITPSRVTPPRRSPAHEMPTPERRARRRGSLAW